MRDMADTAQRWMAGQWDLACASLETEYWTRDLRDEVVVFFAGRRRRVACGVHLAYCYQQRRRAYALLEAKEPAPPVVPVGPAPGAAGVRGGRRTRRAPKRGGSQQAVR